MPFQDPYPFRHTAVPPLDSAASSSPSNSTRSSAYTNSGSALAYFDNNNVHVASPDESVHHGILSSDALAHMLATDPAASSSARGPSVRSPDRTRWSDAYSSSVRSRSSSIGNTAPVPPSVDNTSPRQVHQKPSYDISWQTVNEAEETEEETDDEHGLDIDHLDDGDHVRTAAAVVADEGRGLIVQGDGVPIVQLQVQPGTTHMLIGSSPTPNAVPTFLTSTLPQIAHSLLALDISANFLGALPPVLAVCENLEELNVASNPLRVLPVFLASLSNLCVLIADSTGISTLPDALVDLEKLHTISVRRNKLHALPSWLCLLPALQTLCVDGNPFQGPWKALVDPLLAKVPSTPAYPPSTPMMPLSASLSSNADTEHDPTDADDYSDPEANSTGHSGSPQSLEEEDHTITPERAPLMTRSTTSPFPAASNAPPVPQSRALTRTRTTPNRAYFDQSRTKPNQATPDPPLPRQFAPTKQQDDHHHRGDHEIRKMKSAGDLRRGKSATASNPQDAPKPNLVPNHPGSLSSSNLLNFGSSTTSPAGPSSVDPAYSKRFATLGTNAGFNPSGRPPPNAARPQLSQSMWENGNHIASEPVSRASSFTPSVPPLTSPPPSIEPTDRGNQRQRSAREKSSRWGFLKKMSMGKMKPEPSSTSPSHSPNASPTPNRIASGGRPHTSAGVSNPHFGSISARGGSKTPQIDLRFSTTGNLDAFTLTSPSNSSTQPPPTQQQPTPPQPQALPPREHHLSPPPASNNLLVPPTAPRSKRRSFLPLDAPGAMTSLSIPENSAFVGGVVVSHDNEETDGKQAVAAPGPPSPVPTQEQYMRREEDRAREAYMRALRSVMAYLRDMNDLSVSQQQTNPLSMYGGSSDDSPIGRSRRPTVIDREGSLSASTTDLPSHLRPAESLSGIRSGTSSQTLSVATTDSNGSSGEERKYKDDKGKRNMVIQEIVKTERTYVKGMHELVEIYIKPAATPAHLISGVGSSKETVVPASERKVVFGGIEALFSFHKDNFLPALEEAAAPLMTATAQADTDGRLSIEVAKAVGNIFVKHAAFMRMYSSYINNFDSSLQRVKYWTSDRNAAGPASPGGALSPSSSTAQLAGMGMAMGMTASPGSIAESAPSAASGLPNLTTSQRKKIKAYLKRCRVNPRHTQLNLEGYLLLPVQRIPRYKLLLEELLRSTPPTYEYMDDPLDRALAEISLLANNMNEGKRESESRRKLVQWQARIRGKFPSPLVQPHRRLIMDGPLLLTRVVRKAVVSFEAINAQGDASTVQVDCLAPELTPRQLIGILCNDLLVLCRDPSEGQDPNSVVDLWAVLRMQTLPQPASILIKPALALRLVDNKAILYFDAPSPSDALNWYRAINLHIPASKA